MPLQPDIALAGQPNFPTAFSLQDFGQRMEALKEQKARQQKAQQIQQYFSTHQDALDANTGIITPSAILDLSQIDMTFGQAALKDRMKLLGQSADLAAEDVDTAVKKWNAQSDVIKEGMSRAYTRGATYEGPDGDRDRLAGEEWQSYLKELRDSGMAQKLGFSEDQLNKLAAGTPKWDSIPFRLSKLSEQRAMRQQARTQTLENATEDKPQGTPLSAIPDAAQEQQPLQTATAGGAQYRGAPAGQGPEGVPLSEVGKTPQQEAATAEQGPTVQDPNTLRTTGGEPVVQVDMEGDTTTSEWMKRAREMEAAAERIRKDPSTGEAGQKRSQELRKDANELRAKAIQLRAEERRDEELGLKQQRLQAQLDRNKATQAPLSKEAVDFAVGQYLDGNSQAVTGLARNQTAQAQIKNRIPEMAKERGMKPADVNAAMQRFAGFTQEQRSLAIRAANVALPINELKTFIPLAEKASDAVPRTNFVPINRILQLSRNQWSPEQASFVAANRSIINAFAQLASRGVPTVHSTTEAEAMLNTAQTPDQYKSVLKQLWREAEAARRAVTMSREDARQEATGQAVPEQPYPGNYGKFKAPAMGTKSIKPYSDPDEEKAYQEYKRKHSGG